MDSQTISMAKTNSAIQLYRALERGNLLQYFDQFIAQGGDDLQQLCEAEEGEFFEIMELVGMASKPLHVRRLQKVLQEFMADPKTFETEMVVTAKQPVSTDYNANPEEISPPVGNPYVITMDQQIKQSMSPNGTPGRHLGKSPATPTPPLDGTNLSEEHIKSVRNAAMLILQDLDVDSLPLPRKLPSEMRPILEMGLDHPQRESEVRKWAPIYGRFDSKRKSEKPLSLHEVMVNEASCQLCLLEPKLLFMRDRLFPLSRQVVRESGYPYKHGHSRSHRDMRVPAQREKNKIARLSDASITRTVQAELLKLRREERMSAIAAQLTEIKERQAKLKDKIALAKVDQNLQKIYDLQVELEKLTSQQLTLMTEQTDLIRKQRRSDKYYGAKASKYTGDDQTKTESIKSSSRLAPAEDSPIVSDSPAGRNRSRKKDKRKGAKCSQAFMKRALMDEGLRLAQGFNNGDDGFTDLQNYRLQDDDELKRAYGLKESIAIDDSKSGDLLNINGTNGEEVEGQMNGHIEGHVSQPEGVSLEQMETVPGERDLSLQGDDQSHEEENIRTINTDDLVSENFGMPIVMVSEQPDMAMPAEMLA